MISPGWLGAACALVLGVVCFDARDDERLARNIEAVLRTQGAPGAAVALIEDGRTSWVRGFGVADQASGRRVDVDTPFRAASISKTFVALAAMQQVERGALSLDRPVRELLPEVAIENPWEDTDPVRLAHVLEHTSGFDDIHLCEYANSDPTPLTLEQGLALNPRSRRVRWRPGDRFSYSNGGPPVAARVVEKLTGLTYEQYVARAIFAPLEMPEASFLLTPRVDERLARGYPWGEKTPVPYWHLHQRPSGALNVSVAELAHLVEMFAGGGMYRGRRVISEASIARMRTPATSAAARAGLRFGYGLGLFSTLSRGGVLYGHDGGLMGYGSTFAWSPERRCGYVILVNTNGPAIGLIRELVEARLFGGDRPPRTGAPAAGIAPESLLGTYRFASPRMSVLAFVTHWLTAEIRRDGDALLLDLPGVTQRLIPDGPNLFRVPGSPVPLYAAELDGSGRVDFHGGYFTFQQVPRWHVTLELWLLRFVFCGMVLGIAACLMVPFLPRLAPTRKALGPPALATAIACAWGLAMLFGILRIVDRLGVATPWSISAFVLSCVYPFAVLRCARRWSDTAGAPTAFRVVALASSWANRITLIYMFSWGLIGLRTWSY